MDVSQIPANGWAWFLVAALALLNLYNAISTARKNAREEKKRQEQPTADVCERVEALERYIGNDKRRLDTHEEQIEDIRSGQKVICKGVQALLEHELHNGNSAQMENASEGINGWLVNR